MAVPAAMTETDGVALARACFLDDRNPSAARRPPSLRSRASTGSRPLDAAAAMALNGGVAYSGGVCGAISGAALAVGILAERRIDDHRGAKRVARCWWPA